VHTPPAVRHTPSRVASSTSAVLLTVNVVAAWTIVVGVNKLKISVTTTNKTGNIREIEFLENMDILRL
jgi:hypothetical protein